MPNPVARTMLSGRERCAPSRTIKRRRDIRASRADNRTLVLMHRSATVVLWMILSTCVAAAQASDQIMPQVEIDRPTGDYQIAYLTLMAEDEDAGPQWLVLSLRDGRGAAAWVPSFAPAVDAGGLRLSDGRLAGQVMDVSPAHTPVGRTPLPERALLD